MIDNQFIKKPSGFNKQRLDSFVRSVKTNKQDVQKKELDEALELHTQLMAQDMMQRAMQLPAFPDLQQAYINQGMQQMQQIPQAAYGMEIGAVMPSINSPFTYPSQQNLTPPNSDMFKKNADAYAGKGMSAFKNLFTTAANAVLNPAIQEYNQKVYNAKQKDAKDKEDAEETDLPQEKLGGLIKAQKGLTRAAYLKKSGDLPKAQIMGTTGSTFGSSTGDPKKSEYKPREVQEAETALQENLDRYQSDEPVYDNQGNLLTKDQLQKATQDAYNAYYQAVGQAYKDNPAPSFGGPGDMSYMYNYPTRDGLNLPNVNISGPGVTPELYTGTGADQKYTNMGMDYPGLGAFIGLSPQRYLESNDMNYSPNYKAMYNDALSKGQYDRFETNITANPTVAGNILDKLGIGKMFATRNYDITQNILPEGQSILDPERLAENQRRQTLLANEDMPGGGLFQTDEMDPYIWENRTRRDRRDVLKGAGIDPSRKNLRRLGEDYFENLKQDRIREEAEASREGYENTLAAEDAATRRDVSVATMGKRPRNYWDLVGTGVQSVSPAPAVTGPTNTVVQPAVTPTQPNVVTPNSATSGNTNAAAPTTQPFYNTNYNWNDVQKENADIIKKIGNYEITKGSPLGSGLLAYTPLTTNPEQFYNWQESRTGNYYDYSGHDQNKARFKGFDANALPKDLREVVLDQSINQSTDPRLTMLISQGLVNDTDRYNYDNAKITSLFNDPKNQEALSKAYNEDPKQFINTYLDQRLVTYGRTNKKNFDQNTFNSLSPQEKEKYLSNLEVADAYDYTWEPRIAQYRKQKGGSQLPMFQIEGEYPGIDWNITDPFAKKPGPLFGNDQNKFTLGLPPLFPDANKMRTFFDNGEAPLTAEAFSKELDKYVPKYTGQEPQQLATATGNAKIKSNIAPTTYLTVGNAAGKFLADSVFGRDERKNAEKDYRKSRFLENNLALTSADTQFDPRLRGFDRTTDAFAGAPYAGAQVQYGQPLIAMAQQGTEIPMTMQEGGVYTLTSDMIKQIIDNGGEVEYVDNSNNFVNPFNQ
jgi:hypothetical protein